MSTCDICASPIPDGTRYTTIDLLREHRHGNVITPEHAHQLLITCTRCAPTTSDLATTLRARCGPPTRRTRARTAAHLWRRLLTRP